MTDQPTPRAPEDDDDWGSGTCTVCGKATLYGSRHVQCAPGYVAPQPPAPDDLREQIAEALDGFVRPHGHVPPSCPRCIDPATAVMDVLRRNGTFSEHPSQFYRDLAEDNIRLTEEVERLVKVIRDTCQPNSLLWDAADEVVAKGETHDSSSSEV